MRDRQTIEQMKALPADERVEASKSLMRAMRGDRTPVKCVDMDGRLYCLRQIGDWWYWPHTTDGWRCHLDY